MSRLWLAGAACLCVILGGQPVLAEIVPFGVAFQDRGYRRISEGDGVTVYRHQSASEIRLGAEVQLPAAPARVMATLLDYPGQVGHVKRLSESRVLAHRQGWLRVYQRLSILLLNDRDFTLQVTWGRDREVSWIEYRAVNDGPPPRSGVVRVTRHEGSWLVRPTDGGRASLVRFTVSMDMGGQVPGWMVRPSSAKEIPGLFQAIRGLLSRSSERRVAWFPLK